MRKMKVTDFIVNLLNDIYGVKVIFGYQGSSIAHLIDSISRHPEMEFVEMRHEQGVGFAVDGYSLITGELAVGVACSGPGALNLINGIADAYYDSLPCLFITGQVSQKEQKGSTNIRQLGFQETPIVDIVKPITKYAVSITEVDTLRDRLEEAISIAKKGRPGPVLIDIPHNIQGSNIEDEIIGLSGLEDRKYCIDQNKYTEVIDCLKHAKKPILLIGGGCRSIDEQLANEIDNLNIPVVTSYRGKTKYDNSKVSYCGTIGVYGNRAANWAVKYSDLVVCLGSRLDGRQTGGEMLQKREHQNVIVIDCDPFEFEKYPEEYIRIEDDAILVLKSIVRQSEIVKKDKKWIDIIRAWKERYPIEREYLIEDGVNPNLLLKRISGYANDYSVFSVDVGQNQIWSNSSLLIKQNQSLIQSGGLGAMGFALPAAIGAYYKTERQIICISGDGGIQMNIQELQTIQTQKIPIKLLVLNNNCLGLIRDYQAKALGNRMYGSVVGFGNPRYDKIAEAYGLCYLKLESDRDIGKLSEVLNDNLAYLIEVKIAEVSTSFPEPTYGSSIINQSLELSLEEKDEIEREATI